jgi:hypothetical protein
MIKHLETNNIFYPNLIPTEYNEFFFLKNYFSSMLSVIFIPIKFDVTELRK